MKKGYSFKGKDGTMFLVRCHECERENYSMMVATGQCAWCGYKVNKKKKQKV